MKKVLFTLLIVFSASLVNAKIVRIIRSGSADGVHYNKVDEYHGLITDKLTCSGQGAITCSWTTEIPYFGNISAVEVEDFVMSEITLGNVNGTTNYNGILNVTWTYDSDKDILEIIMNDGEK